MFPPNSLDQKGSDIESPYMKYSLTHLKIVYEKNIRVALFSEVKFEANFFWIYLQV